MTPEERAHLTIGLVTGLVTGFLTGVLFLPLLEWLT